MLHLCVVQYEAFYFDSVDIDYSYVAQGTFDPRRTIFYTVALVLDRLYLEFFSLNQGRKKDVLANV
jgi:hypothetical protein